MRSDKMTKGVERASHRSLLYAMGMVKESRAAFNWHCKFE